MITCSMQDLVIARYLDGDTHGEGPVSHESASQNSASQDSAPPADSHGPRHDRATEGSERNVDPTNSAGHEDPLAQHLRGCETCKQMLRSARQIDATLSRLAGSEVAQCLGHTRQASIHRRLDRAAEEAMDRAAAYQAVAGGDSKPAPSMGTNRGLRRAALTVAAALVCFLGGVQVARTLEQQTSPVEFSHGELSTAELHPDRLTGSVDPEADRVGPSAFAIKRGSRGMQLVVARVSDGTDPAVTEQEIALRLPTMGNLRPQPTNDLAGWIAVVRSQDLSARLFASTPTLCLLQTTETLIVGAAQGLPRQTNHPVVALANAQPLHRFASSVVDSLQVHGMHRLARSTRSDALLPFTRWIANAPAGPTLERVLADARTVSSLPRRLARRLIRSSSSVRPTPDQAEILMTAVALGDPILDARLVACLDSVATLRNHSASLRTLKRRPGRTDFLLALFARAERLGLSENRVELAGFCFEGQPEDVAFDLLEYATHSPNIEHRHRALAALARRTLPEAAGPLCQLVHDGPLPIAESAAFALAKHGATLAGAEITPRDLRGQRAHLFAAVLADVGTLPEHLLAPAQGEGFLTHGHFSRAQFSIAVGELRRRLASTNSRRSPVTDS